MFPWALIFGLQLASAVTLQEAYDDPETFIYYDPSKPKLFLYFDAI